MTDDLWICKRKMHLPEYDGATGYYYYEPVEPYIAQSEAITLEPTITLRELKETIDEMRKQQPEDFTMGMKVTDEEWQEQHDEKESVEIHNAALDALWEKVQKGRV